MSDEENALLDGVFRIVDGAPLLVSEDDVLAFVGRSRLVVRTMEEADAMFGDRKFWCVHIVGSLLAFPVQSHEMGVRLKEMINREFNVFESSSHVPFAAYLAPWPWFKLIYLDDVSKGLGLSQQYILPSYRW